MSQHSFESMGFRFRIRSDIPGASAVVGRLLAPFAAAPPHVDADYDMRSTGGAPFELFLNGSSIQAVRHPGSMVDWIVADVSRKSLCEASDRVVVHAAVLRSSGGAVLLPAPPDHGKTTMALGLWQAGMTLLSDEAALVALDGRVVTGFPRPLMVSPESMRLFPELSASLTRAYEPFRHVDHHVSFADLGQPWRTEPSDVRVVVAPRFEPGSRTSLEPVSRAETLTLLLEQTFNLAIHRGRAALALAEMLRGVECYRLTYGNLSRAVGMVCGVVGHDPAGRTVAETDLVGR